MVRPLRWAHRVAFALATLSISPVYLNAEEAAFDLLGPEVAAVGVDQPGVDANEAGCGGDGDQGTRTPEPAEHETVENPDASFTPAPEETGDVVAPLTEDLVELRSKVRSVLRMYQPRCLNTREHNPWEVMHAVIGFGVDANLRRGGPKGEKVNAVSWLCYNGACKGQQMLWVSNGQLTARQGVGLQGHYGQFLAILAQSHVPLDYPVVVNNKHFTLADLLEHEKRDCRAGEELTFKLIATMHYMQDSDETWKSRDGQTWSIERLVREELAQPIRGAACGGTHRLMGLSYAVNKRIKRGQSVTGEFARAQKFVNDYHRYTFGLQNADGSFSTQWFNRREAKPDVDRRLKTTGHILEWLVFSLSDEELRKPNVVKAVNYLSGIMLEGNRRTWEIGPIGHASHALVVYDRRVFQPHDASQPEIASRKRPKAE
jgi:hypothetical protein